MDEELKQRFLQQKLQDLLNENIRPFPTVLCEMEYPYNIELVRKVCMICGAMVPFRVKGNLKDVTERLDRQKELLDYGNLYIDVNVN